MERVARESLRTMANYRKVLEGASGPGKRIFASRRKAMRLLLSPFSQGPNPLLEELFPEEAFPSLHALGFPRDSWLTELLDAAAGRPPERRESEAILTDAIRLSAVALAAGALARELTHPSQDPAEIALPDAPSPLLILISDEEGLPDEDREVLIGRIDAACRNQVKIYRLPSVAFLPAFGRRVYEKWGIPLSMARGIAVIFSSSLTPGLAALALGFSLVPIPGYPIQGSPLLENILTQKMRTSLGHAYLKVSPREDPCDAILRSLTI